MKIIIFSDTHLGNQFDQKQYNALKRIIESADRVIINGDFWDYHLCSWDEFLNSEWSTLFPLLKERKAQYTFGNHDPKRFIDDRAYAFCDHFATEVRINLYDKILRIQHGNKIAPSIDETMPIVLKSKRLVQLSYACFNLGVKLLGKNFLKIGRIKNARMKNWAKRNLTENEILVCGDSHCAEVNLEKQFINSGLIRFGYLEYIAIIDKHLRFYSSRY